MVRMYYKFLDGEAIFRKWVSLGKGANYNLLYRWAISQNIRNPRTGKPPVKMALWNSMWRWALKNPEASRVLYNQYLLQFGDYADEVKWAKILDEKKSLYRSKDTDEYIAKRLGTPG